MSEQPIPRIALTWLLVAQVLVIVPHLTHLPAWISGLWLLCAGWRIQVYRMRAGYPGGLVKGVMMIAALLGIFAGSRTLIGLDAGVILLVSTFTLKLVEMKTRRDALVVVFLGFFVVVTSYLFDDSLLAALYSLLPVTALLAALIGLQQGGLSERPLPTLKLAASLLLQALPLMLVIFLLFPRMGPLWSLPLPGARGMTGLSESMSPSEITELTRSSALAFRVGFEGPLPPRTQLYWRALTLEHFDGVKWSQLEHEVRSQSPQWQRQGEPLDYRVIMEPSGKQWLFALDTATTSADKVQQASDFRLQAQRPVTQRLMYPVRSWPQALREPQGSQRLVWDLQLPPGNPRSRELARELRQRHASNDAALVSELLRRFSFAPYRYTLTPPAVGSDTIDGFLFDSQAGFCAHYAGAMTFVLRAAGIPARVVAGYQGGELNPDGNYLMVRQYDAHAWVEYWLPQRGWVMVDPTYQVAPERIEMGLEQALGEEADIGVEGGLLSQQQYRDLPWLNAVRMRWDSLNYSWQRKVLGYQGEEQMRLLTGWFGQLDATRIALLMVGSAGVMLLILALLMLKPWQRERDPQLRLFQRFEQLLARAGVARQPGEGPRDYARRAARALPQQAAEIQAFMQAFEQQRYARRPPAGNPAAAALVALRRRLPWRVRLPGVR